MSNDRGQYGSRPRVPYAGIGAAPAGPPGRSIVPWLIGGGVLAAVGLAVVGAHRAQQPRLTAHEREVAAWEHEFPGLPWYADQVKDSRQMDMWERARNYWEKTH